MVSYLILSILSVTSPTLPEAKKPAASAKAVKNTTPSAAVPSAAPPSVSQEAQDVVAQAFAAPQQTSLTTEAKKEPAPVQPTSFWLPVMALGGLAIAAFLLSRKKQRQSGIIQILETTSLGPRRSLIVAQIQGQTLLMAASEAGISILSVDVKVPVATPVVDYATQRSLGEFTSELSSPIRAALGALFPSRAQTASFEQTLQEVTQMPVSGEDEDLRAKLAAGLRGRK